MSLLLRHLEANGSLPPADLEAATRHQRSAGGSLDSALLELGLVTPLQLDELLRAACGLPGAPVRLLERGPTRPWEHVPKDLVDIGWVIPLAHEGGQVIAAVHPDLPDAKLGALYRQIRGFTPVVAPECCLAKVAAERSGAILSPRYAMLVLDYLQALRDRDAADDEPAPPAPRPIRGPSDTNPVRPASGKSPAARPALEAPRPLQAVPQDRPAAPDLPAAPAPQDRSPAAPEPALQDRQPADAPAAPPAPQAARPSAVLPATAQLERPHLSAPPASPDRRDNPAPTVAPIRRRSGPSPAAPIPTAPPAGAPTTQSQRLAAAKAALAGARERDRITEALVRAAVIIAPRVGLFGVKREGLRVLAAPTSALRLTEGLVIPLPEGGPLDGAVSGQTALNLLTEPSLSFAVGQPLGIPCVFEPVLAGGRTVLMLYLDRAGVAFDPVERATIRELCDVARQSLESLLRLLGWVVPSGTVEAGPGDRSPARPHLAQGVFIPPVPTNLAPKPPAPEPPAEPRPAAPPPVEPRPAAPPAAAEPAAEPPPTAPPAASTEPRAAALPAPPPDLARPAPEPTPRPVRSPYPGTLLARSPADLMSQPHPAPTSDAPPSEPVRTDEPASTEPAPAPAAPTVEAAPSESVEPVARPVVAEVSSDHPAARPTEVSGEHPTAPGDSVTAGRRSSRGGRGRAVITLVNPIRRDEAPPTPPTDAAPATATPEIGPESPLAARFAALAAADDSPTASPRPASQPDAQASPLPPAEPAPSAEPVTDVSPPLTGPAQAAAPVAEATPPSVTAQPVTPVADIPHSLVRAPVDTPSPVTRAPSQAADVAQPVARPPSQAVDIPRSLLRPTSQPDAAQAGAPATRTPSQALVAATIPPLTRPPAQPAATIPPLTRPPSQPSHGAAEPLVATIPPLITRPPAQPLTGAPQPVEPATDMRLGTGPQAQALADMSQEAAQPSPADTPEAAPARTDSPIEPASRAPSAASPAADAPAPASRAPSAASPAADAPAPASVAPSAAGAPEAAPALAAAPAPAPEASPSTPAEPVPADSTAAAPAPKTALNMPNLIAPPGARAPARRRAGEPASEPVLVIPKTLRRSTTLTATPHPMARRTERDAPAEQPAPAPAAAAPAPTLSIPTSLINPRGGRRRGKNEPRPEPPPSLHMPRLVREADAAPPPAAEAPAPAPETLAAAPGPIAQVPGASPPAPAAVAAEPAPAETTAPETSTPEAAAAEAPAPADGPADAEPAPPEHPTTDDDIDAVIEAFLQSPTDWNAGARLRALDARGLARLAARFPGPIDLANATNFPPPSAHGPLLRACVELGQAIAPHILALFGSQRPQIRFYAAFLFQELRDPRCLRPLGELAFDPDPDVRLIATRVLESYSRVPDFLAVATRIRAELDNRDRERQLLAAEAAGTLRDTFAVPRLIDLLAVRDNNLREAALEALCSITAKHHGYRAARWRSWYADHGDESRIEWVMDGLRHRDVAVRRWAADELVRITGQRIPFPVEGDRRSRDAALRLWQEWWDSNRDEFTRKP